VDRRTQHSGKRPLNNRYSRYFEATVTGSVSDHELHTASGWSGSGVEELQLFIRNRLTQSGVQQITVVAAQNFLPEVYVTRLFTLEEPRIIVLEARYERWDFPFFVAKHQRSVEQGREGDKAEVYLVAQAICQRLAPDPCESSVFSSPGITLTLEREIFRAARDNRFMVFYASHVTDEQLKGLTPVNDGRYPDGFVAPLMMERVSIHGEKEAQAIVITGVALSELVKDKMSVTVDGAEVPFVFEREEERFRIVLRDALLSGERVVRVFFGEWQLRLDPCEKLAAYPNIQRAVSARDVELFVRSKEGV
jgi:hypothetical protein